MATNYGANLQQFLKLPKAPSSSSVQDGFKVSFGSKPKAPTAKHLSTKTTMSKLPKISDIGGSSKSSSSPIFGSSSKHVFTTSKVEGEFSGIKYPTPATKEQRMWLRQQKQSQHAHSGGISGFISNALNNPVGKGLEDTLGLLSRPYHAAAAIGNATPGHDVNPHDVAKGFSNALGELEGHATQSQGKGQPKTHADALDALKQNGTLLHTIAHKGGNYHRLATGIGFGLDVAVDPLNLVGGAGVWTKAGRGFELTRGLSELDKAGQTGKHIADLSRYEHYANLARDVAPQMSNRMLEHLASMRAKGYHLLNEIPAPLAEEHLADTQKLNMLSRTLQAEAKSNMSRYLGVRIGGKTAGVTLRTPIKTGGTLAERLNRAEHGNILARGAAHVATAFKPGYLDPVGHSLALTARHMGERLTVSSWRKAWASLKEFKHIKPRQREDIMAAVTHKPGIVDPVTHEVNVKALDAALKEAGFSGDKLTEARAFVKAWHSVTEHLRVSDERAHVIYEKTHPADQLYIPHIFEKKGGARFFASKSMLSKAGFEKHGQNLTYQQILGMERGLGQKGGKYVTDPLELIAHRLQKGAMAQTHAMTRQLIRETWGKASHYTSDKLRQEAHAPLEDMHTQRRLLEHMPEVAHGRRANQIMNAGKARTKAYRDITERQFVSQSKSRKIEQQYAKDLKAARSLKGSSKRPASPWLIAEHERVAKVAREDAYTAAAKANQTVSKARGHEIEQSYKDAVAQAHLAHSRTTDKTAKDLASLDEGIAQATQKAANDSWKAHPTSEFAGHEHIATLDMKIPGTTHVMKTYVPTEIADQVKNVEKFMVDPGFANSVERSMAKAMSVWKLGVTVVNPGYRVRNTMSDLWNMFVSGVPAAALPVYMSKAAKFQAEIKLAQRKLEAGAVLSGGELKTLRIANEMHDHGILSGQFMGDVAKLVKRQSSDSKVRKVFRAPLVANIHAENNTRIAHFLYRLDHGYSISGAAEQVRMAHFDYEDLTPTEQRIKGSLIPFYTWTRKNVPYQLKMLAENPARFNHFMQTAQFSEKESGASPHDVIGTALNFYPTAFKAGGGYVSAQIGLNDVINAGDPGNFVASQLNPFLKAGIELGTGHKLGTGDAISGTDAAHQRTPAPGFLSDILSTVGLGGQTARLGPDGTTIHGPGVDNKVAYLLQQFPLTGAALAQNPIDRSNRGNSRLLSYLTGVGYITPNEKREKVIAEVQNAAAEKAYFKNLRDEGKIPEAHYTKSKSRYQAQLDKYLKQSIQRGR